jgi:putative selenate reductase molybdopterin-binding subunit
MRNPSFRDYRIPCSLDMPKMTVHLVPTHEPSGPFGAKSIAEIPLDGPAPAIANAVRDALGIRLRRLPMTPERLWKEWHAEWQRHAPTATAVIAAPVAQKARSR